MNKKFYLSIIIPLYGPNCAAVSARLFASLATLKVSVPIQYLIYYDDTVPAKAVEQIRYLFTIHGNKNVTVKIIYSANTSSGYKRNQGVIEGCATSELIWFIDQDDFLITDSLDDVIRCAMKVAKTDKIPVFGIKFQRPQDNRYETNIDKIIIMPWQYLYDADRVKDYRFSETFEMGSDLPFVWKILSDFSGEQEEQKIETKYYVRPIYFYNYMNVDSCSFKYFVIDGNRETESLAKDILKNG